MEFIGYFKDLVKEKSERIAELELLVIFLNRGGNVMKFASADDTPVHGWRFTSFGWNKGLRTAEDFLQVEEQEPKTEIPTSLSVETIHWLKKHA